MRRGGRVRRARRRDRLLRDPRALGSGPRLAQRGPAGLRAGLHRARRLVRDAAGGPDQPPLRQPYGPARAARAVDALADPAVPGAEPAGPVPGDVRLRRLRGHGGRGDERAGGRGRTAARQVDHVRAARHVERGRAHRLGGRHARRPPRRGRAHPLPAGLGRPHGARRARLLLGAGPAARRGRGAAAAVRAAAPFRAADRHGRLLRGVRGGGEPGLVGGVPAGPAGQLGRAGGGLDHRVHADDGRGQDRRRRGGEPVRRGAHGPRRRRPRGARRAAGGGRRAAGGGDGRLRPDGAGHRGGRTAVFRRRRARGTQPQPGHRRCGDHHLHLGARRAQPDRRGGPGDQPGGLVRRGDGAGVRARGVRGRAAQRRARARAGGQSAGRSSSRATLLKPSLHGAGRRVAASSRTSTRAPRA
ncbi:hypothetical protein SGPA1_20432 [Streptomyces misionensis JCM 4497]